ncbi:hypothetical protein [Moorena producens]|uniref:hypothetical protein n=1 Tax=Moorena producens TaxID=1155739 RepID=UPI0011EA7094|nr:hypothetical protein [Moorena producens]
MEWAYWWNGHLAGTGILLWNEHLGGMGILVERASCPLSIFSGRQDAHPNPINCLIQQRP